MSTDSVDSGTYLAPTRQTVREFMTQWPDGVKSEVEITGWTSYRNAVNLYVLPHLGRRRLSDLSPLDLKAWHTKLLSSGSASGGPLAPRTVQIAHRVLHRALADACRWKVLHSNPASEVRSPKVVRKEMQVWTAAEAGQFLRAVAGDRLNAVWVVALHTGMRRGELASRRQRWKR